MAILFVFPRAMYPTTIIHGMDRLLAITVLAIAWTDIALAALAYHHDVGSTVRARSIIEPWTISIVAFAWSYISLDDGLIVSYVFSMVAALIAALIPLVRSYGIPRDWKPGPWHCLVDRPAATSRSPPPMRSNGHHAGSTWRSSARSCRQALSAFIMSPSRLRLFRPSSRPASSRFWDRQSRARSPLEIVQSIAKQLRQVTYWIIAAQARHRVGPWRSRVEP